MNDVLKDQLTYEDALTVNSLCLFEGEKHKVLDEDRLRSALGNQFQPYASNELAFASMYKSLVINHGFMNGNKRTAVIMLYLASKMIRNDLMISDEDLASLTYQIAGEGGSNIPVEEIAKKVFGLNTKKRNFSPIDNVIDAVKEFIKGHEWLMKELGK